MHKKIYFGNRPLFISTARSEEMEPWAAGENAIVREGTPPDEIKSVIRQMLETDTTAGIFLHPAPEQVWQSVTDALPVIRAAGGLVHTDDGRVLLIFRRGKWDLPKGKLDEGESLDDCAVREVREETGMEAISLEEPLCITYHTYPEGGKPVLKESHWYRMRTKKAGVLTPQTEEDIEKCEWVRPEDLAPYLENTFPNIIDVVKKGLPAIKKEARS